MHMPRFTLHVPGFRYGRNGEKQFLRQSFAGRGGNAKCNQSHTLGLEPACGAPGGHCGASLFRDKLCHNEINRERASRDRAMERQYASRLWNSDWGFLMAAVAAAAG